MFCVPSNKKGPSLLKRKQAIKQETNKQINKRKGREGNGRGDEASATAAIPNFGRCLQPEMSVFYAVSLSKIYTLKSRHKFRIYVYSKLYFTKIKFIINLKALKMNLPWNSIRAFFFNPISTAKVHQKINTKLSNFLIPAFKISNFMDIIPYQLI